jgi:hypothetical protein
MGLPSMLGAMNDSTHLTDSQHLPHPVYHIRLSSHLDLCWAEWFDGMTIANEPDGRCLLAGRVADQAALHGLLNKIRDLGLTLLEVKCVSKVEG